MLKSKMKDYLIEFFNQETDENYEIVVQSPTEKMAIETAAKHLTSSIDSTFLLGTVYITVDDLDKVTFH